MLRYCHCDLSQSNTRSFIEALATAEDQHHAERYKRPARSLQSLAGRALIRALVRQSGVATPEAFEIETSPAGRPNGRLGNVVFDISISHSDDLVAAALTDIGPIGIDVEHEKTTRAYRQIAERIFGAQEQQSVQQEGSAAFYRIWTLREAFAKARDVSFAEVLAPTDHFGSVKDLSSRQIANRPWLFRHQRCGAAYSLSLALTSPTRAGLDEATAVLQQETLLLP